jgi:tripartite-type tricarboxylate transporter receptor subunit TctC
VQRELEPLALITTSPYVMVAHPAIGVKTVPELIAYAKARAGKLSYSAGSPGSVQHLAGEMFKRNAGVDIVFVPYKGSGALLQDMLAGNLQIVFDSALLLAPHIKSGALRALAVTSLRRSPILPDVPSLAEAGVQGIDASGWQSMFVAPRTAPEIVGKLNAEILAIVNTPETRDRLLTLGATPLLGTPDDLRKLLAREVPAWRKVIQDAGIKGD